jgi:hypothetical protein
MHAFAFLWLGVDSLIAAAAISPLMTGRSRYALAIWFGIADGAGFVIGAMIGWHAPAAVSTLTAPAVMGLYGGYLLLAAVLSRRFPRRWPVWVLPVVLSLDNFGYGLTRRLGAGAALHQAMPQVAASGLLALAGLLTAARWAPSRPRAAGVLAGGGLLAGALLLLT